MNYDNPSTVLSVNSHQSTAPIARETNPLSDKEGDASNDIQKTNHENPVRIPPFVSGPTPDQYQMEE